MSHNDIFLTQMTTAVCGVQVTHRPHPFYLQLHDVKRPDYHHTLVSDLRYDRHLHTFLSIAIPSHIHNMDGPVIKPSSRPSRRPPSGARASPKGPPSTLKTSVVKPRNPLSYPKSDEPFSTRLFRNPTSEYRGCPLWAWNTRLEKEHLLRQIDDFQAMGLGGFHMHSRTGLDTDYMGPEFMDAVKTCVDYAEEKGMLACL